MIPHYYEMLTARAQFQAEADIEICTERWLQSNQWLRSWGVNVAAAINIIGPVLELDVRPMPGGIFDFASDRDGVRAFVHHVYERDAATPCDLLAWTKDQPRHPLRFFGYSDALGVDQVHNPTSYFDGAGLIVHHSALDWLRSDCRGVVVLDYVAFRHRLTILDPSISNCRLLRDTVAGARDLSRKLQPLPDRVQIFVPASLLEAAA